MWSGSDKSSSKLSQSGSTTTPRKSLSQRKLTQLSLVFVLQQTLLRACNVAMTNPRSGAAIGDGPRALLMDLQFPYLLTMKMMASGSVFGRALES